VKKNKKIVFGITFLTILIYTGLIVGWHLYTPQKHLTIQVPGADNRPEGLTRSAQDVTIGEYFMKYIETPLVTSLTGKWTRFRGKDATNIVKTLEAISIPESDYPIIWGVETGEGYAAPVVYNGRVYFLDYNEQLSSDALRCFSLETGEELWRRWYRVPMKRNHGFSRTVPAIGDDYIVTIGPEAHVMCCDPITGDLKWSIDMQKEYGTKMPGWYTGQCPLVDDGVAILAPGGDEVLLMGLDVQTGEILWTVPNTLNFEMSHSSVMPMTLSGKKTYVYIANGGVIGVSAEKYDQGTLLWTSIQWRPTVVAPSPLQLSANEMFLVAGYGAGGARLRVDRSGNQWTAKILEEYKPNEGLSSEQQTPILYNNMIVSIMPKDGGAIRERLVMYLPSNLRSPIWSSNERFGMGPYIVIDNYLFLFNDNGELFVYEIESRGMKLVKRQVVIEDGLDAWGPIAYADGMLFVGDAHNIKCLKIK
jgi:outer membrane protein assembly factor BamB